MNCRLANGQGVLARLMPNGLYLLVFYGLYVPYKEIIFI